MAVGAIFSSVESGTPYFVFQNEKFVGPGEAIEPEPFILFTPNSAGLLDKINGAVIVNMVAYGAYTLQLDTENPPMRDKVIVSHGKPKPIPGHPNIGVTLGEV